MKHDFRKIFMSVTSPQGKIIVMLGTSVSNKGGMTSVIESYKRAGLFDRWPIVYLTTHKQGSYPDKVRTAAAALVKFLCILVRRQAAVAHVMSAAGASFWRKAIFILLATIGRCPVIFHLHGGYFVDFYSRGGVLKKSIIRFVLNRVTVIIALSNEWKMSLSNITSNPNVICIPNIVHEEWLKYDPARQRDGTQLVFLGNIWVEKGVFDLLKAFAAIHEKYPDMKLILAGEGQLGEASREAVNLGIAEFVELPGWVSGDTKGQLLENATICLLPSYVECLPMAILEAMGAGIPVIATNVGGIPDAVENGVEGILVRPGDITGLEQAMDKLLADAELRSRMGHAGRQKVLQHYTAEKVIPPLEGLYDRFLNTDKYFA